MNHAFAMRLPVIVFTLLSVIACDSAQSANSTTTLSAQELEVLREACTALPRNPARRDECGGVVARLAAPKSAAAPPTSLGRAREEIKLRSIPFASGDARDALRELCFHLGDVDKREKLERCKFDKNGRMIMAFTFGNIRNVADIFVSSEGSLMSFEMAGTKSEMLQLAALLEEKYGQPSREENEVKNKLGRKFSQQVFRWTDSRGTVIEVHTIYDSIDFGQVALKSATTMQSIEAMQKLQKDANKGKLKSPQSNKPA